MRGSQQGSNPTKKKKAVTGNREILSVREIAQPMKKDTNGLSIINWSGQKASTQVILYRLTY